MRQLLLKIANKIIQRFGSENKLEPQKEETILENVFKTNFNKKVLISYLKQPFLEGIKYHHTNYLECYTAAEVFKELGYDVDVIDLFDDATNVEYEKYSVVYGLGHALEKAFYFEETEKIIKILYSTGYNPFFSFKASAKQVQNFYIEKGKFLPHSSRVQKTFWTYQYFSSSLVIALGNKDVAKSFTDINADINVIPVPAFYFDVNDIDISNKDFSKAKKNFLWFGSHGLLHKGLDIALDFFIKRNDLTLHICGADLGEFKFWKYYNPLILNCKNIILHDFIDINSKKFIDILNLCAFAIFPTASEGGSPSLLNIIANGGLIPIASKNCGIDLENLGFLMDDINLNSLGNQIELVESKNDLVLLEISCNIKKFVRENYSYDNYKCNLKSAIYSVISV